MTHLIEAVVHLGADNTTRKVDFDELDKILDTSWPSATVIHAYGRWKGTREGSAMIVLYIDEDERGKVKGFAEELRVRFEQEEVLVVFKPLLD